MNNGYRTIDVSQASDYWIVGPGDPVYLDSDDRANAFYMFENIRGESGKFEKRKIYPDRPVDHIRVSGTPANVPDHQEVYFRGEDEPLVYGDIYGFRPAISFPVFGEHVAGACPIVPSELLGDLGFSAMERFSQDIQEKGSILNFLYELKDFHILFGKLSTLWHRLLEFVNKPLLTWEFAIKPFFEDLANFVETFQYVRERLAFLKAFDGKTTHVTYVVSSVADRMGWVPDVPRERKERGESWDILDLEYFCTEFRCTFRAHALVKIKCKDIDKLGRNLDAFAAAIGIGSILQWIKAGYKAFPFSWLFDFFVKSNRFFSTWHSDVFATVGSSAIKVLSTTSSLKYTWTVKAQSYMPEGTKIEAGTYYGKRYWRKHGLPDDSGSLVRSHNWGDNLSMLAILLTILAPGNPWKPRR